MIEVPHYTSFMSTAYLPIEGSSRSAAMESGIYSWITTRSKSRCGCHHSHKFRIPCSGLTRRLAQKDWFSFLIESSLNRIRILCVQICSSFLRHNIQVHSDTGYALAKNPVRAEIVSVSVITCALCNLIVESVSCTRSLYVRQSRCLWKCNPSNFPSVWNQAKVLVIETHR